MDYKKIKLKWLVLVVFFFLFSCGVREVTKNTSLQESNKETELKETQNRKDSASAKIQKLSENLSFNLEPINGNTANFIYIVGKDTIRVETNGKLSLNKAKTNESKDILKTTILNTKKDSISSEKTKVKTKEQNTKRTNNSFQFILIGILITILFQIAFKELKKRYFI